MHSLLDVFYNATGMNINIEKYCIYTHNIQLDNLKELRELFQFKFEQMETSFKYLDLFLKPNSYRVNDWHWLIKKIDNKISNWSYRFLTLGVSLTLIKTTLQSIPIYWCSLVKLPVSVISSIQKKIFHFLWTGLNVERKFHFAPSEILASPTDQGGWGIKNLSLFNLHFVSNPLGDAFYPRICGVM